MEKGCIMKDWKDIKEDNREKYKLYLCSREWNEKVVKVIKRSKNLCERCKKNQGSQTHHLTYIRLYKERLDDLAYLCSDCHQYISGRSDYDPCKKKPRKKS
jgi:hypothetical protein